MLYSCSVSLFSGSFTFVRFPAGFSGRIDSQGATFRAVVIKGRLEYGAPETTTLDQGSYFGSRAPTQHEISSAGAGETIIYVRTDGGYALVREDGRGER